MFNKTPRADRQNDDAARAVTALSLDNQAECPDAAAVFVAADALHKLIGKRRPSLPRSGCSTTNVPRRLQSRQPQYRQRLKITSLTFLFTDLKGSTALYERVGDLAAFDLVRARFARCSRSSRPNSGAVVKTIGDAVMATFVTPAHATRRRLAHARRRWTSAQCRARHAGTVVKIGIHEGPCLAVMLNERQDYFGQTVNIAARVQESVDVAGDPYAPAPVSNAPAVATFCERGARTFRFERGRAARNRRQDRGLRNSLDLHMNPVHLEIKA